MTRADANRFLARLRTGEVDACQSVIEYALRLTGDLCDPIETPSVPLQPMVVDTYLNRGTRVMRETTA